VEELREYLQRNIQTITQWARQIPGIGLTPVQATYLGWLDFRKLHWKVEELSQRMILEAGIGLNEGIAYGKEGEGFMRINLACPKQVLTASLEKIEKMIRAHSKT
jgi:cystathionine beta-lyase